MLGVDGDLAVDVRRVGKVDAEVVVGGSGAPIVVLHGFHNLPVQSPFLRKLTACGTVYAPSLPGFGHTARPDDFDTTYDLVNFCLDLVDGLAQEPVTLIGLSFGGWVALELATKNMPRLERLVLIDTLGVKLSDRETPDIADIFNLHPDDIHARRWVDQEAGRLDFDAMSDDEIVVYAKNREALCLYGWDPYMYTPQLAQWLHRIQVPSLVLWGEQDRIVDTTYGRGIASRLPDARFEVIAGAAHHPEVEQVEQVVEHIGAFVMQERGD